jgi:hypothetical protein
MQTQAVTYIVQRMTSLAGMFYIMSLTFYLKARTSGDTRWKAVFFLVSLIAFLLGMVSKENVILLLPTIGLVELLLFHKTRTDSPRRTGLILTGIAGAACVIGFLWALLANGDVFSTIFSGYDHRPFTLWQRLLTESRVIIIYLSLLLYPMPDRLSIAHGLGISTSMVNPVSTLASLLLIAGIVGSLIVVAKKYPLISFSFLFFLVNHLLESTVLPLELVYEHRNYIPSMLFFVPFAMGFTHLLERFRPKRGMRLALCLFGSFTLMGFAHATYERNLVWKSPETLWVDTQKAPLESRVCNLDHIQGGSRRRPW